MEHIEAIKEFGGWLNRYRHRSQACDCDMTFSVYCPARRRKSAGGSLSGLTCTDDNFRVKAGAQRYAAELGLALVIPTPARAAGGAGCTGALRSRSRRRFLRECHPGTVVATLSHVRLRHPRAAGAGGSKSADYRSTFHHRPFDGRPRRTNLRIAGTGTLPFRLPPSRQSVTRWPVAGGKKGCFKAYLGPNREDWVAYDAVRLIEEGAQAIPLLIDQGTADEFLAQQLHSASLERMCRPRFSADPAVARRLRSQLSLHRHLHRRASRLSRQDVARCLVSLHASFGIFVKQDLTETLCKVCCGAN